MGRKRPLKKELERVVSPVSDPRLIKGHIESIQSAINDFARGAHKHGGRVEDPETRLALASLNLEVDLLRTLMIIALESYVQDLNARIAEIEKRPNVDRLGG